MLTGSTIYSCSRDDEPEKQKNEELDKKVEDWENIDMDGDATLVSAPIQFFIGSFGGETRSSTTYAGVCNLETNDLVAVGITRNGESEVVKLYKVLSTGYLQYAGSDEPFLWNSQSEQVSVRAWSYGTSTRTANTLTPPESYDYSLETDQDSNGYNELLYCKAMDKKCSDGTITFTFYHQLARVVFNVTHERTGTFSVNSSSIGNTTSFPVVARFSVPIGDSNYGTWATTSTYNTITPKTETTQSGYEKTYSAVVFPATTYAENTKFFTIKNDDGNYVYSIPASSDVTLSAGNQYYYAITVKDAKDVRKNPLYYLAEYRLAEDGVSFDDIPGWHVTYMRTFSNAMSLGYSYTTSKYDGYAVPATPKKINGVAYHIPTKQEWFSISPLDWTNGQQYLYESGSEATLGVSVTAGVIRNENCTFGYSNATKYRNGSNNTDATGVTYQSFWSSVYGSAPFATWHTNTTDAIRYAIRFIGTEFCSVWRYKQTGTPGAQDATGRRWEISSRLIDPISSSDLTALSSKITEIVSASESYWTDATWGAVKRTIYWGGYSTGTGRTYPNANNNGHYVSASLTYFNLACTGMTAEASSENFGFDVLLFRDE